VKIGDLVRLAEWTYFPLQIGQIVEIVDNCTYRVLVGGDVRNFTDFDYEVIDESR
jgi:phosphopantetheine adenylyltransferase